MHAVSLNLSPRTRPTSFSDLLTWSWTWLTSATWEELLGAPTSRDHSTLHIIPSGFPARPFPAANRPIPALDDSLFHFPALSGGRADRERLLIGSTISPP